MPGVTGAFGWPFPTGSDRVMDGDNAIEALAEAIENSLSMLRPTQGGSTADLQLTTVNQLIPGTGRAPITTLVSEIWVIVTSVFWHATTIGFGDCTAEVFVNGAAIAPSQPSQQYSPPAVPERVTVTHHNLIFVGAGVPTALELRAKCSLAGGVVKVRIGTTYTLMRFPVVTAGALREALGDTLEEMR
jgi:hypothetical protein